MFKKKLEECIRKSCGTEKPLTLYEPYFISNEKKYLSLCIEENYVSYIGKYVKEFEESLKRFIGVKHAIAMVNGTSALHIALIASGIKSDEEVLLPSFTFIATANAVSYIGAIAHFIDIEDKFLGICPNKLEEYLTEIIVQKNGLSYNKVTNRRISAIILTHTFGFSSYGIKIQEIARKYNLIFIEDAAQSLGSFEENIHTGNFGIAGALSFNGNKIITTGGGGAVVTNDDAIAAKVYHLSTTAKKNILYHYVHDEIGYNYRMPNINAAVGCAQIEVLNTFLQNKRNLSERYFFNLRELEEINFLTEREGTKANYWLNTIVLNNNIDLNEILEFLNQNGIGARAAWQPLHTLSCYKDNPRSNSLFVTENMFKRVINIPSSAFL